jgi:hypothetical protein
MRIWSICIMVAVLLLGAQSPLKVNAQDLPALSIELMSPSEVHGFPGIEQMVKAKITNNTNAAVPDVMAYITMADIRKHMTVNLEDYSADKPVVLGELKANESRVVELPVRFVYTSSYFLYVTAVSTKIPAVQSSKAIPIDIISNSKMDINAVRTVTFGIPIIMVLVLIGVIIFRRRNWRISE